MDPEPAATEPDWNAVIAQAKNGSDPAARWLVEALHGHVLRIVRNHLPRNADEQDLVQEVFLKVFTHIDSFRATQPFPNWVARIALNTCYDQLRKQKARPEVRFADLSDADIEFIDSLVARRESPAPSYEPDGRGLVEKLLATLKPNEQRVIRLLDLEKKSLREASELTGWGLSKLKVTALRARRKLNANLKILERRIP